MFFVEFDEYRLGCLGSGRWLCPSNNRSNPNDIKTFGVGATFVTSTAVAEDVIYQIVKAVFDNFGDFKKLHPAFGGLVESEMIKDVLSAPPRRG